MAKTKKRGPKPDTLRITMDPGEALDRLLSTPKGTRRKMDPPIYQKRKRPERKP